VLANGTFEAQRLPGYAEHPADFARLHVDLGGDLFRRWLAPVFLLQLARHPVQPADAVTHVNRHADRPPLVGNGPGDRLADPPRGVSAEAVAAPVVEFLDGF